MWQYRIIHSNLCKVKKNNRVA